MKTIKPVCGICKNRVHEKDVPVKAGGDRPHHYRPQFKCGVTGKVVGYWHHPCMRFEDTFTK